MQVQVGWVIWVVDLELDFDTWVYIGLDGVCMVLSSRKGNIVGKNYYVITHTF